MKTLRDLKVGDEVIVIENDRPGHRVLYTTTIKTIGRRWLTVERWVTTRFDIDTGDNDSYFGSRSVPRIGTPAMLELQDRRAALSDEIQTVIAPHGYWRGDNLSVEKLERIAAILREP